jgi:bacterioferritin-associated ferredoxin
VTSFTLRPNAAGLEESLIRYLNGPNYALPVESRPVIVCICNSLPERQICASRDAGACTVRELFASLNCEPRCATCVPEIEELLTQSYALSSSSPAADCA